MKRCVCSCPQVLLWVLVSLLPVVEGVHVRAAAEGSDSSHAVGVLGGQEEKEFPVTLPEVVEDKEDDSDPHSTWHALYGTILQAF